MRIILVYIIINLLVGHIYGQLPHLNPTITKQLDFGPEAQKEWEQRDSIYAAISRGEKSYQTLTQEERALIRKYSEAQINFWDIIGEGCSWYCGAGSFEKSASSTLPAQGGNTYEAVNAHDLSYQTAWVEGADGYGIGEYLEYTFPASHPRVTDVIVVNGYVKSRKAWHENSRVKTLKMYVNDTLHAILHLEDVYAEQRFEVGIVGDSSLFRTEKTANRPDWTIRFEIADVYPGEKYADVAITEIYFDGLDVHCLIAGTLITMADGSKKPIESLSIGDEVLSYNTETQIFEPASVLELASAVHCDLIQIKLTDGSTITATSDHPFFDGTDWRSYDPAKTQQDYTFNTVLPMRCGDKLLLQYGQVEIAELKAVHQPQPTYTIVELSRNSIFIAQGILVGTEPIRHLTHVK